MCKKKPGPRCSAGTLARLTAISAEKEKVSSYIAANSDMYNRIQGKSFVGNRLTEEEKQFSGEFSGYLVAGRNVDLRLEKAELEFAASPKGLKALEKQFDSNQLEKHLLIESGTASRGIAPAITEVKVKSSDLAKNKFDSASFHRKSQTYMLTELEKAEADGLDNALFKAEAFRSELKNLLTHSKESVDRIEASIQVALLDLRKTDASEDLDEAGKTKKKAAIGRTLAQAFLVREHNKLLSKYTEIRLADLEEYVELAKAKQSGFSPFAHRVGPVRVGDDPKLLDAPANRAQVLIPMLEVDGSALPSENNKSQAEIRDAIFKARLGQFS